MTESSGSLLVTRLAALARWRRVILVNTFLVAAVAVAVSFLLPKSYRSSASVYPPQEETFSVGTLSSIVAATAFGQGRQSLPIWASPSDVYAAILKSRSVREEIVRRHDLMKEYKVDTMDDALRSLRSHAKVRVGGEGVVSVSVVDRDPVRAADMANDFITLLDARARERRSTSAGSVRAFLEKRLAECSDSLQAAEAALQTIQEETGILVPDEQAKALVAGAVQIELARKMREVDLGILRAQVGPSDPDRSRLSREVALLEQQLAASDQGTSDERAAYRIPLARFPERAHAYTRALRDVKIQEALYEILAEQYEQYRITELRDTPTVQVLDRAVPAERRYRPIRWLICVIATLLAFGASCALALVLDALERMRRESPGDWNRLRGIGGAMKPRNWFSSGGDLSAP